MEPYRTTKQGDAAATVIGANLVVSQGGTLPKICLKCGATKKLVSRTHRFEHAPPGLAFGFLFSPLVYVALALLMRRTAPATISLCKPCDARWKDARTASAMITPASAIALVAVATAFFNDAPLVAALLLVSSTAALVWVHLRFVRRRTVDVQWIDKRGIALAGVHADAAKRAVDPSAYRAETDLAPPSAPDASTG